MTTVFLGESKMILEKLKNEINTLIITKSLIPKPKTDNEFKILRLGKRRGESAVIYSIPNHKEPSFHYEKGITYSEFLQVLKELSETGYVTRSWFNKNLLECAKEGSCNFTSLCGILELLGYCKYSEKGKYVSLKK